MSLTFAQWSQLQNSHKIYVAEITLLAAVNKTLRIGSESIVLGGNYYEGAIKSLPYFSRSIKDIGYGISRISYGPLEINNGDGWLDSDVSNYNWVGAEVVIKYGGKELDFANYATVVTAWVRDIEINDQIIRLTLADKSIKLLRHKTPAQTWDDIAVYSIVDSILTDAGIAAADRDSALWTQFETDANMTGYVVSDGTEAASTLLDRILAPLMFWYGFSRDGLFQVALLTTAASSDYDILKDVEEMEFGQAPYDKQYWKIALSYISDKTTTPPTTTETSKEDSTIKTTYPLAMQSGVKETVLRVAADATTTLDRWWNMFSVQRWVLKTALKAQGFGLNIGDGFSLIRDRYGITGNFRVVSVYEDYDRGLVRMEGLQ